ncbi:MAG: hypothetical protein LBH66_05325 [Oscillospiraceae bacterium]|jgi:predicted outer membrane repeat protein|nr:hypothetical protein [Oscillospiraceae bacterium]
MANNRSTRSAPSAAPAPQAVTAGNYTTLQFLIANNNTADLQIPSDFIMTSPLVINGNNDITIKSQSGIRKLIRSPALGGDAIVIHPGGKLTLINIEINGNESAVTAVPGALIAMSGATSVLNLQSGATVTRNRNDISNGGLIRADGGTINMTGSSFVSYGSAENGGGIALSQTAYLNEGPQASIIYNTASNNGGGVSGIAWYGQMHIAGTVANNTADKNGGGIYVPKSSLDQVYVESTASFSANSAKSPVVLRKPSDEALYQSHIAGTTWTAYNQGYNNLDIAYNRLASSVSSSRRMMFFHGHSNPVLLCDRPHNAPVDLACGCSTDQDGGVCCNISHPTCPT